ncbi:3-methylcrotonyl-CoA carboxylase [Paramicrosporidium saccamoebae]|uniref:3-methylcrotonyl-CoA carboxylase n=1 Tax=Paramicrosporidium saccamoebae TaxID=1246581 RepID=A0A2H9TMF0_9FUNG|nr:3-methylcrotonyl-CoA carboxylase [Paramicrosporidium saccamoebae]
MPNNNANVRIETGVREDDEISVYYDPMIAKVVVHGETRLESLRRLDQTLGEFHVAGVRTNISLIRKILAEDQFKSGLVDTSFIKQHHDRLFAKTSPNTNHLALSAVLHVISNQTGNNMHDPWLQNDGYSGFIERTTLLKIKAYNNVYSCNVSVESKSEFMVRVEGPQLFEFVSEGSEGLNKGPSENSVLSPMPCRVSQVPIKVGDRVKKGGVLMIVEAMKMEHIIKAPMDVKIAKINYSEGQLVGEKKQLIEFSDSCE